MDVFNKVETLIMRLNSTAAPRCVYQVLSEANGASTWLLKLEFRSQDSRSSGITYTQEDPSNQGHYIYNDLFSSTLSNITSWVDHDSHSAPAALLNNVFKGKVNNLVQLVFWWQYRHLALLHLYTK